MCFKLYSLYEDIVLQLKSDVVLSISYGRLYLTPLKVVQFNSNFLLFIEKFLGPTIQYELSGILVIQISCSFKDVAGILRF